MLDETTAVERATIDVTLDGRRSQVAIEGVTENQMTPLTNPVTGDENDGADRQDERLHLARRRDRPGREVSSVDLPEMNWDLAGRHAVFSTFDYTNA